MPIPLQKKQNIPKCNSPVFCFQTNSDCLCWVNAIYQEWFWVGLENAFREITNRIAMSTRTPFVFVKCCFGGPRSFPPFALFSMLLPDISCLAPVGGLPVQRIVCSNKCFAPRTPLSNKQRARTEHQVRFKTTAHILFLRSPILKIFKPKPPPCTLFDITCWGKHRLRRK